MIRLAAMGVGFPMYSTEAKDASLVVSVSPICCKQQMSHACDGQRRESRRERCCRIAHKSQ